MFQKLINDKSDYWPTCDEVCQEFDSHQPDYTEFMKLDLERLREFRFKRKHAILFNVVAGYDYQRKLWVDSHGTRISDLSWQNSAFPMLNNELKIVFM